MQQIDIYAPQGRVATSDDALQAVELSVAAQGEAGSEHKVTLAGPFGRLTGVLHLGRSEAARQRLLVMAHGFRGSMDGGGRAIALARQAQELMTVLRFNFSACQTLSAQVQELHDVVTAAGDALRPQRLYLLGRSLGGATAIAMLAKYAVRMGGTPALTFGNTPLGGLVLWSAPNSLEQTFRKVLTDAGFDHLLAGRDLQLCDWRGEFTVHPETIADMLEYDLDACLRSLSGLPVCIVHGTADAVVLPQEAWANWEACGQPKMLHWVIGGDHSFIADSAEANAVVVEWLREKTAVHS